MAFKDKNSEWYKRFSPERYFEGLFRNVGKTLDSKVGGTSNPIILDLAGMDALMDVLNILCRNVITSFTPILEIEGGDEDSPALSEKIGSNEAPAIEVKGGSRTWPIILGT